LTGPMANASRLLVRPWPAPPSSAKGGSRAHPRRATAPATASEGPPWKRKEGRRRQAQEGGWGGVARKGAGRMRDEGADASKAFREAHPEGRSPGNPSSGSTRAVRGEAKRRRRPRPEPPIPRDGPRRRRTGADPSLGRAVRAAASSGPSSACASASRPSSGSASRRPARSCRRWPRRRPRPSRSASCSGSPTTASVGGSRRPSSWRPSAASAVHRAAPGLADCYRALGRHAKVAELWEELRAASPSAALVAEGASSRRVAGRPGPLDDAIRLLSAAKTPAKRPKDHHLRVTYALADLYERAGDIPGPGSSSSSGRATTPSSATSPPGSGPLRRWPSAARWAAGRCHTPVRRVARLPPSTFRTGTVGGNPCPYPPSTHPLAGTNLAVPRRRAEPRRRAPHPPVRRRAGRPRAHGRPDDGTRPSRCRRLALAHGRGATWSAGEELVVTGRCTPRYFRAGGTTQSRTEVVATGSSHPPDGGGRKAVGSRCSVTERL
jgi:hypothetical protein